MDEGLKPADSGERRSCEQAPALDAGGHCNALNQHADSVQKIIIIARLFTALWGASGQFETSGPTKSQLESSRSFDAEGYEAAN